MDIDNNDICIMKDEELFVSSKEYIFPNNVQESVDKLIKNEGYLTFEINKEPFSPKGDNFLGTICAVNIKGKTIKGDDKETDVIIKFITQGEHTTFLSMSDVYIRELFVYKELSSVFQELEEQFVVPAEDRYNIVRSFDESNPEVIILENMLIKGYKTYNKMDFISLDFAELAVKEMAKFHGLSFVLKTKRPKYFEKRVQILKHPFNFNEDWQNFVASLSGITLSYLTGGAKKKMEDFVPKFMEKYKRYLEDEESKLCLCHGDYRPNNIMMKESNGQISEVIPIDYQLIYYGCPVLDFIYFIFSATDQAFRRAHLPNLKDVYHNTLTNFLKFFNINIDRVFSREQFECMYAARLDYGLLISLLLVPILMAMEDEVPDLNIESIANMKFETDDKFKDRMVGIVNDFIYWGYL